MSKDYSTTFHSQSDSRVPVETSNKNVLLSTRPKPGEKGWLVALAEKSSDTVKSANILSQDKVSNGCSSHEQNSQASSSAFELLETQENPSKLSNPDENFQPKTLSENLGIMAVPETGSVDPILHWSLEAESRIDQDQDQDSQKYDANTDTLAQDCSDIIKRLNPTINEFVLMEDQHKEMFKSTFKTAPKKKSVINPINVDELLVKLKPVEFESVTNKCPAPAQIKVKANFPAIIAGSNPKKKDASAPSFRQHSASSFQNFEDIIDSLITKSIFTSESRRSQPDLSVTHSRNDQNQTEKKIEAQRKRKVAKKPKNERTPSTSTKRKLNLTKDILSKPTAKRVKPVSCKETKAALLRLQEIRTDGTWAKCTNTECGKWRHLAIKDPAEVREFFVCQDNPDSRYGSCEAPEQLWSIEDSSLMVETRFSVGSLVWAKMTGWPAWPAMVDDDPDTGSFFWTEMVEDKWTDKPSS